MKRILVLAMAMLVSPTLVSAQLEIGLDAGFGYKMQDDIDLGEGATIEGDNVTAFGLPTTSGFLPMVSGARVAFAAGESALIESLLSFGYQSTDDDSVTLFGLVPGVNFLITEQFYVRGEAGLSYLSFGDDDNLTQYLFGGGAGYRQMLGEGAVFRFEVAVDRLLEEEDERIPASWDFRAVVGISAVVN